MTEVETGLEKTIEELREEIVELKKVIKDMAKALSVLTQKDEDAKIYYARLIEIAEWQEAVRIEEAKEEEARDA